jgi:uncharacterized membrane protein
VRQGIRLLMNSKSVIHVGIALILLGIATLIFQSAPYLRLEKLSEANSAAVLEDTKKPRPLSPLAGAVLLGSGVVFLAVGFKMSGWRRKALL